MKTHPMKLVTVVCEALARDRITGLLAEEGARGHTAYPVTGFGAKGERRGEIEEFGNVQIEVIVPPAVAERLLERLARDILPHFATVVYESDVRVLRQEKF